MYLTVLGLSCSMQTLSGGMWDLVPWPETQFGPPALGAWSFSHWTTRAVPLVQFWITILMVVFVPLAFLSFYRFISKLSPTLGRFPPDPVWAAPQLLPSGSSCSWSPWPAVICCPCKPVLPIRLSVWFSSAAQLCLTLRDPMDCGTLGFPVHHQLPEPTQTCVHQVGDAIQPSYLLSSPSPPDLNLFQHQGLF